MKMSQPTENRITPVSPSPGLQFLTALKLKIREELYGPRRGRRFWEVDALRGIAIVMMVLYHLMYDLFFFRITDAIFANRFWFYFQRTDASLFIGLVGLSLTLSYARLKQRGKAVSYWKYFRRGLRIFGWGLVITLVTWLALGPRLAIRFGILHFIGVSIMLAYPFLRFRWPNLLLGVLFIGVGKYLQTQTFDLPWLVWLGFEPPNHYYLDYFPLIKWFGVVLFGIFAGNLLYRENGRIIRLPDLSDYLPVRVLQSLGQHSLAIYLIHQPILFAILVPTLLILGVGVVAF